jgi:ribosomal protein S18 acetylase RimI-like enzyme
VDGTGRGRAVSGRRVATPDDRDAVVATVVAAFAQDPAFRYFFQDDDTFATEAATLAGTLFDARVGFGTVWTTEDVTALSMWVPPRVEAAIHDPTPLGVSAEARARIDRYDAAVHGHLPDEPHWYLGVLATHPDHAGRRLGRAMIEPGLERAVADGLPAVLETTNPRNVELYRRAGWTVEAEITDGPIPIWVLTVRP